MTKISAVIITKNEAQHINDCIDSLEMVADEVLIYDSFSTDATKSICLEKNVKFIEGEWRGYAETKNKANQLTTHPYILSIDADERLSKELSKKILAEKPHLKGAYSLNRLNNYCGHWIRHGGFYPDKKIRLFNKNDGEWQGSHVHEKLFLQQEVPVKHLNADLLHYSYKSISDHVQRADKYSCLAAEGLKMKNNLGWKMWFSPAFRFLQTYFFKGGFRDGFYGLCICSITSYEVFLKYSKAKMLKMHGQ